MKKILVSFILVIALLVLPVNAALAATTQDVTITATPSYITISNSPGSNDFGVISASSTPSTANGYFTITNGSSVAIDISIQCNGWDGGANDWTYGAPGADQAQLAASSAQGGSGGSSGAGAFDITVLNGSDTLLCDNVGTSTNPTWELQLQAPTSFNFANQQTTTVTLTATAN